MMLSIALVLATLVACEAAMALAGLPVPGAALGLLAMTAAFCLLGAPERGMARTFDALAPHAPLFFVPAAAGVIARPDLVAAHWLPLVAAAVAGTAVALVVAGVAAQALLGRAPGGTEEADA